MKSERQEARMAEVCSGVGCWAAAESVMSTASPAASNIARHQLDEELHHEPHFTQTSLFGRGTLHDRAAAVQHALYCHSAVALRLAD
jgi:hypothetical protein